MTLDEARRLRLDRLSPESDDSGLSATGKVEHR
jgi:hypothetical protein